MSGTAEPSAEVGNVSNQLATLVPTFDPAVDNVEIWSSKVELLLLAWPPTKILELATRLVLNCKGTAYQKAQLLRSEILVNDEKGIKRLVEIVGGTWGQVPIEAKFELVEKALFKSVQKGDETADSYLSRCDVIWTDLLSRKVDLEEIRAYIILRGSRLNSEDKKRVVVESGAEKGQALDLKRVSSAIRMLGSGFFQDLVGAKRDKSLKTYDHTAFAMDDIPESAEGEADTFWTMDDSLDDSTLEQLAAEDDEDAALVMQFEDAISENIQNDKELSAFYSSYQDARKRLSEKVKYRGFWSVRRTGKDGKSGGKKGKGKGKNRQSLAHRIANSYCRICLQKGHWKDECPSKNNATSSGGPPSSTAPTSFVTTTQGQDLDALSDVPTTNDACLPEVEFCFTVLDNLLSFRRNRQSQLGKLSNSQVPSMKHVPRKCPGSELRSHTAVPVRTIVQQLKAIKDQRSPITVSVDDHVSLFASVGSVGVVDLGASQTVIGSDQVPQLLEQVPDWVRQKVKRKSCNLVFRFGNHQTLVSRQALLFPLDDQYFQVAVVPGNTPFLLSSAFLRGIKAVIDTDEGTMWSKVLGRNLVVTRSVKNLFLMDLNQLWKPDGHHDDPLGRPTEDDCLITEQVSKGSAEQCLQPTPSDSAQSQIPNDSRDPSRVVQMSQCSATMSDCANVQVSGSSHPLDVSGQPCVNQSSVHHAVGVRQAECLPPTGREPAIPFQSSGTSSDDPGRSREGSDRVWNCQTGNAVCPGFQRPQVDGLVCQHLREEWKGDPHEVHHVCREATGQRSANRDDSSHGTKGEATQDARRTIGCLLEPGQGGELQRQQQLRSPGGQASPSAHHPGVPDAPDARGEPESPQPPWSDGGRLDRADQPRESSQCTEVESTSESDVVTLFQTQCEFQHNIPKNSQTESFKAKINKLTKQFEHELYQTKTPKCQTRRLDVLEVMCHSQSELTKQTLAQGGNAKRFGLSDGDLKTVEGRQQLFKILVRERPKNVWYSPTCAPWCLWNQFNEKTSMKTCEKIFQTRLDNLWQISLGIVMFRYQQSQQNHYHQEQPDRSLMKYVPGMHEILSHTHECRFDLCRVGDLKEPVTGEAIRKRLDVLTTSIEMKNCLHGKFCQGEHQHHHVAGSTMYQGNRIPLSQFTEMYPRKFAKQLARVMLNDKTHPILGETTEEHPTKRRRLSTKMGPTEIEQKFPSVNWQTVMTAVNRLAPRVGTSVIESGELVEMVQKLCPQHEVHHIVLCRGVDRYLGPNKSLPKGVAPLRRMICIRRKFEDIHVDEEWEPWERLTFKGLRRKSVAARVSATIFARVKYPDVPAASPSADTAIRTRSCESTDPEASGSKRFKPNPAEEVTMPVPNAISSDESHQVPESNPIEVSPDRHVIDLASQKHGPKFMTLETDEQAWLLKIHRNLGHPGSQKLVEFCRQLKCPDRILHAIPELKCSTCAETKPPTIARPEPFMSLPVLVM